MNCCDAHVTSENFAAQPPYLLWVISRHVRRSKACPLYPQSRPRKRIFAKGHVCFTPKSGHVRCTRRCLLRANSGHGASHIKNKSDYFMAGMLPFPGIFICISAGIVVLSSFWKVGRSSGDVITSAP